MLKSGEDHYLKKYLSATQSLIDNIQERFCTFIRSRSLRLGIFCPKKHITPKLA